MKYSPSTYSWPKSLIRLVSPHTTSCGLTPTRERVLFKVDARRRETRRAVEFIFVLFARQLSPEHMYRVLTTIRDEVHRLRGQTRTYDLTGRKVVLTDAMAKTSSVLFVMKNYAKSSPRYNTVLPLCTYF